MPCPLPHRGWVYKDAGQSRMTVYDTQPKTKHTTRLSKSISILYCVLFTVRRYLLLETYRNATKEKKEHWSDNSCSKKKPSVRWKHLNNGSFVYIRSVSELLRQERGKRWRKESFACTRTMSELLHQGQGAVSYTHLDVYKRQPSMAFL